MDTQTVFLSYYQWSTEEAAPKAECAHKMEKKKEEIHHHKSQYVEGVERKTLAWEDIRMIDQ